MKKTISVLLSLILTLTVTAQTGQRSIKVTENIAYRTDVGPSTVLDVAEPQFGPQTNRPAILIIHGGGWSAGSKNDMVYRTLMTDYAMKGTTDSCRKLPCLLVSRTCAAPSAG